MFRALAGSKGKLLTTDENSFEEEFQRKYAAQAEKIGRFNLAVFGKTGAGKSTLINAIFGEDVAPTGIGEPVTKEEHLYLHRAGFFGLLDTRGLEIGVDTDTIIRELGEYVAEMRQKPLEEQIHVAWYCVRAGGSRFEDTEADFIRRLRELGLPIIVVLTQVQSRDGEHHPAATELSERIVQRALPIESNRPVLVMASADEFSQQVQHGLQDLLDATFRAAPEGVEGALAAAQKIDLGRKAALAHRAIVAAGVTAAAVGAAPIPIADAVVLVPIQIGLMASVAAIYGVKIDTATIAASAATSIAVGAGKAVAVGLFKLIPGPGWLIGGAINAVTASGLTVAIGYSWAAVCAQLTQGKLKGLDGAIDTKALAKLFKDELAARLSKVLPSKP